MGSRGCWSWGELQDEGRLRAGEPDGKPLQDCWRGGAGSTTMMVLEVKVTSYGNAD